MGVVVLGRDNTEGAGRDSIDDAGSVKLERSLERLEDDVGRARRERGFAGPLRDSPALRDHALQERAVAEGVERADRNPRTLAGLVTALTILLDAIEQFPPLFL